MFTKNQIVRGVVTGRFQVVKTHESKTGPTIVTVKELGPNGELSRGTMRFPADILKAE